MNRYIKNWYFGNRGTNRVQTSHSDISQGPLITDGRNSSKWARHYVGWTKFLQMARISDHNF